MGPEGRRSVTGPEGQLEGQVPTCGSRVGRVWIHPSIQEGTASSTADADRQPLPSRS